jgi:hypothetical protein
MSIYRSIILFLCITVILGCKSRQSPKIADDLQAQQKSILSGNFQ